MAGVCAALLTLATLGLQACGGGPVPRPSPVPESADFLDQGRSAYVHGDYLGALDQFAAAYRQGMMEDNLFTQVVADLNVALTERQLARADPANAADHGRRAFRAHQRAAALLPALRREQPNVDERDLHRLLGDYYSLEARRHQRAGDFDAMRDALDEGERHYRAALE